METQTKNQKENASQKENSQFREFFIEELKDIYGAEKALHEALPELVQAATSKKVAQSFEKHVQETAQQMKILDEVFELMGEKPEAKKCAAMEGLIKEANTVIKDTEKDTFTRDAGLILAGQKVEHYEIASYGTLAVFAEQLGETEVAGRLRKILENEKKTDVTLTMAAENGINERAAAE